MEVRYRGYARYDGYGSATFYYVRALRQLGHEVEYLPLDHMEGPDFQELAVTNPKVVDIDSPIINHSTEKGRADEIRYIVWEGMRAPHYLVETANNSREVWTASEFCKQAFYYGGVDREITVVPHGIEPEWFNPNIKPMFDFGDDFIFLTVMKWLNRKNMYGTIIAFGTEFRNEEDVKLMIHTTPLGEEVIKNNVPEEYRKKIILTNKYPLRFNQMGSLYTSADAFILNSYGEAWGLPLSEAGACGLPVLSLYWGGCPAFLSKYAYYVEVERLGWFTGINEHKGILLATPPTESMLETRIQMRQIYDYPEHAKHMGQKLMRHLRENFTWRQAAEKMIERLEGLDGKGNADT